MASKNRNFAKHQFLFSNRLFKFLTNQCPNRNYNDQLFLILAITVFLVPLLVTVIYELLTDEYSLQLIVKIIPKFVTGFIFFIVYLNTYFYFVTIRILINRFKLDYEQYSNQEELNILQKYINQSRLYVYALIFFFEVNCFVIIFPSIFNVFLYSIGKLKDNQLTLPLLKNNIGNAGMLYYSMLLYQTIGIFMITVLGSIGLSTFLIFIQHACCQCSIIKLKIRQPFERNHKSGQNNRYFSTQTEENNWISEIVNYHRISIEYVKMIRYTSDVTYLIIILFSMIILVFNFLCILEFSVLLETLKDKIECIMYVTGCVFTLYINFYLGQRLLNHSNAVLEELSKVPFYTLSVNTQKLLLFIIVRSGKPSFLSIGKMFDASYEVFAALMQKALSFAMVYYSVK